MIGWTHEPRHHRPHGRHQRHRPGRRPPLRLLEAKRHALAGLVAAGELDDAQMWVVQESLDQEEIRLNRLLRTGLARAA
ncbi:hypothetical protein [Amycolatopsis thermoflava]|uniref:hypothetical protein n=1 Tax=Amycolatopsis thermoflava TaxID=84480 RepID=UPI003D74ED00